MTRFRLSTLMLVIVIVALSVALVVQDRRAALVEAERRAQALSLMEDTLRQLAAIRIASPPSAPLDEKTDMDFEDTEDGEVSSATFFRLLPTAGRPGYPRFLARDAFGYSFLSNIFMCEYNNSYGTWQGFLRPCNGSSEAKALLEKYIDTSKKDGAEVRQLRADGADEIVRCKLVGLVDVVFRKGNSVAGAHGASDAYVAESFARELARTLPATVPNLPDGVDE
jgi:hypothetical protein